MMMLAPATAARTLGYVAFGEYALATVAPRATAWLASESACERFHEVCEPIGPTMSATFSGVAAWAGFGAARGATSAMASKAAAKRRNAGTASVAPATRRVGPGRPCEPRRILSGTVVPCGQAGAHGPYVLPTGGSFRERGLHAG